MNQLPNDYDFNKFCWLTIVIIYVTLMPFMLHAATPTPTRTITPSAGVWFQMTATPTQNEIQEFKNKVYQLSNYGQDFNMFFDMWKYKDANGVQVLFLFYAPTSKLASGKTKIIDTLADWNISTYKILTGTAMINDSDMRYVFLNGKPM